MVSFERERKFFARPTDEAMNSGGISIGEGEIGNVPGDYGPAADHGVAANGDTRSDGAVRANAGALSYQGGDESFWTATASGEQIVGEHGVWAKENIVFTGYAIPQVYTALYSDAITESYAALDEGMVADIAVLANGTTLKDVSKSPHAGPLADLATFDKGMGMDKNSGV